jgi:predicted esterase
MRQLSYLAQPGQYAETLIVLLPGAYHQPEDFIKEGFVKAVHERQLPIDLMMAELLFEHIADETALTEINTDLIQPALGKGYQNIWLAGISIGGYVTIAYANRYPEKLAGLLLLAPYPGNRITTGEIAQAGGILEWLPEAAAVDDTELGNWGWLKANANTKDIEIHLGYGENDRFSESHSMMAQTLPPQHVDKIPGGHAWPVWQKLWHNFLDKRFIEYGQHE